jgi:hypothetical protein
MVQYGQDSLNISNMASYDFKIGQDGPNIIWSPDGPQLAQHARKIAPKMGQDSQRCPQDEIDIEIEAKRQQQ